MDNVAGRHGHFGLRRWSPMAEQTQCTPLDVAMGCGHFLQSAFGIQTVRMRIDVDGSAKTVIAELSPELLTDTSAGSPRSIALEALNLELF